PGETNTYTVYLENTSATDLVDLNLAERLPAGFAFVPGSIVTHSRSGVFFVLDEFEDESYLNNDGSMTWSTGWTEINDDQDWDGGEIRINNNRIRFDRADDGQGIYRSADFTGAYQLTLSFNYEADSLEEEMQLFVSTNRAGPFVLLDTFTGNQQENVSYDISAYLSSNTTILFQNNDGDWNANNDEFYFDDLRIEATYPSCPVQPPPAMLQNCFLGSRGVIAFSFDAVYQTPVYAAGDIVNTVEVSSVSLASPVVAQYTNQFLPPISVTKSGSIEGFWPEGATNTYTIRIRNNLAQAFTGLTVDDVLPTGVHYVPGSLRSPGLTGSGFVFDDFSDVSYSNQHGSMDWITDWIEVNGDSTPANVRIFIESGIQRLSFLRLLDQQGIQRSANTLGATALSLSFDYQEIGLEEELELYVAASRNGPWVLLETFSGTTALSTRSYDISAFMSEDTTVRFFNDDGNWSAWNDQFAVYELRIDGTYPTCPVSAPPGRLVSGCSLAAG
ncbi:MAG: hypothetical protein AAF492_21360, partial [Verrucomicrobiota bacterium]